LENSVAPFFVNFKAIGSKEHLDLLLDQMILEFSSKYEKSIDIYA